MKYTKFARDLKKIYDLAIQEGNLGVALKVKELEAKYLLPSQSVLTPENLLDHLHNLSEQTLAQFLKKNREHRPIDLSI